jgi:hypothetical protein
MEKSKSALQIYPAPHGVPANEDFTVRVRLEGEEWRELFCNEVRVDMHEVRSASMVTFDFQGIVEVEVSPGGGTVLEGGAAGQVLVRPQSLGIIPQVEDERITFRLDRPVKLSIEIGGDRFHNLHLFANRLEEDAPSPDSPDVVYIEPCVHDPVELVKRLKMLGGTSEGGRESEENRRSRVLYFGPGMHRIEGGLLPVPSDTTVYLAGGAVVVGSMLCREVENVTIRGRGFIHMRDMEKTTYLRSVQIDLSRNITVEGIVSIDPPHYSIHLGQSENVTIRNFKAFSTRGWCDGIDMMSCRNIVIDDVFLRTSDDCIAIYGSRGEFTGDTASVTVTNAVLWADVAHPVMIGVHGDHAGNGDIIEDIRFDQVDILEHHEPQDGYWGCIAINAGDKNTVRNASFRNVRIEPFELGRLFDIRVFHNPRYNPSPGRDVSDIRFEHVEYNGNCPNPSVIEGYDEARQVSGVEFRDLRINGHSILSPKDGNFLIGSHVRNVTFTG